MSLLDPPNILPNAMYLICKALATRGSIDQQRLKSLVQPSSLKLRQDGANTYDATLRAAVDLGLVHRAATEVRLAEEVPTDSPSSFYVQVLTSIMLSSDDPAGPANDFLRVLTWWSSQDPYGPVFEWSRAENQMLRQYQDSGARPVKNSNPYASFGRWAVALGFAERHAGGIVPDATRAVRSLIPVLGYERIVPLSRLLADLRERLPVLDGGRMAKEERQLLHDEAICRADVAAVDAYFTHALLRCHDEGVIRLSAPSDAESVLLSNGGVGVSWSHVEAGTGEVV